MIEGYEAAHGLKFDLVVRSRPDLAYLMPVKPYCEYMQQERFVYAHYKVSNPNLQVYSLNKIQ